MDTEKKRRIPIAVWILLIIFAPCLVIGTVLFPIFEQAKLAAKKSIALAHIKNLAASAFTYSIDYDNHLPMAKNWESSLATYVKPETAFTSDFDGPCKLALNAGVSGVSTNKMKDTDTVVLFFLGSKMENSPSGTKTDLRLVNESALISTVIGKAKWSKSDEQSSYVWEISK